MRSSADRFVCNARNGQAHFGGYTTARDVIHQFWEKATQQRDDLACARIAETEIPGTCSLNVRAWSELVADHNMLAKKFNFSVRTLLTLKGIPEETKSVAQRQPVKTKSKNRQRRRN